jgi:hypothetical protein
VATVKTPLDKLAEEYESKFTACQQARVQIEKQWYTNLAFYYGRHWATWTPGGRDPSTSLVMIEPPAPRWRVRSTTNKIKPKIRKELTKLTREEPQFYVVPSSTEEQDLACARAGEQIADFLIHSNDFNGIRTQATFWTTVTGTGFIKTFWDSNKKDKDGVQGKICWEAPSPFHIYVPDLQEQTMENQPYFFHARSFDPDVVEDLFGKEVTGDVEVSGSHLDQRFKNVLGIRSDKTRENKKVFVKEVWVKPCRQFKDGAHFFMANGKILKMYEGDKEPGTGDIPVTGEVVSDYPYEHNMFPLVKITHIPMGRFYGGSIIEDLIPLQKEYNRTRSQMIEAKNRTSKPAWVIEKGSVDPNKITSEPGLIIEVMPGFAHPEALKNPELPGNVPLELDISLRDMDDVASQYEISQGRTPPGVEAASAIAYLQEENDTVLYHTVASIEQAVEEAGVQALALAWQFWDEPRTIRIVSINNAYESKKFKSSDLGGILDFRVEAGSMAPRSRAAKQAFIVELMKDGVIPAQLALKYLQMNETNRLYQEMQQDARQAQRENLRLSDGMVFEPNPWDNHLAHLAEHESYMKTQEFENLPDTVRAGFLAHWNATRMALMNQSMDEMEQGNVDGSELESGGTEPGTEPVGDESGGELL